MLFHRRVKKLEATIKPYLLDDLKQALQEEGLVGMTVSEIRDFSPPDKTASHTFLKCCVPRLKIEIVVTDEDLEIAANIIQSARLTPGTEDAFTVHNVDDVIRIRTAEHGVGAI